MTKIIEHICLLCLFMVISLTPIFSQDDNEEDFFMADPIKVYYEVNLMAGVAMGKDIDKRSTSNIIGVLGINKQLNRKLGIGFHVLAGWQSSYGDNTSALGLGSRIHFYNDKPYNDMTIGINHVWREKVRNGSRHAWTGLEFSKSLNKYICLASSLNMMNGYDNNPDALVINLGLKTKGWAATGVTLGAAGLGLYYILLLIGGA